MVLTPHRHLQPTSLTLRSGIMLVYMLSTDRRMVIVNVPQGDKREKAGVVCLMSMGSDHN